MKKKLFAVLLSAVLVLALVPASVFAVSSGVSFTATVSPAKLTYNAESAQTVTVTINADRPVVVDGIAMDLPYPEGWSIASITNNDVVFKASHVVLKVKDKNLGKILWDAFDDPYGGEDQTVTNIAVITYNVPAGTDVGAYDLVAEAFELTSGGGDIWEDEAEVEFTIEVVAAPTPVSGITVSPKENQAVVGEEPITLTAEVTPEAADDTTVTWTSSNTDVATVDASGNVTGVAPGVATITATTNGTNASGAQLSDTAQVTVYKKIAVPEAEDLEYTGSEQTGVPGGEGYVITGNKATNAGDYTATATLAQYYMWENGSTDPATIEWSIARVEIAVPEGEDLEYTGSELTGVPAGTGYTVTGNKATDAGDYTATVTLDQNHIWEDGSEEPKEVSWSIQPKKVARPEAKDDLVYNGSEQTGVEEGEGYTLTGNKGTDAGNYEATASLKPNYAWEDGDDDDATVRWSIAQAPLEDGTLELAVGETKELDDDESLSYDTEDENIELDGNKVTGKEEGTATIVVVSDGTGNYLAGDAEITVTITKTPATGDKTMIWVGTAALAVVVLAVYLFVEKKREQR